MRRINLLTYLFTYFLQPQCLQCWIHATVVSGCSQTSTGPTPIFSSLQSGVTGGTPPPSAGSSVAPGPRTSLDDVVSISSSDNSSNMYLSPDRITASSSPASQLQTFEMHTEQVWKNKLHPTSTVVPLTLTYTTRFTHGDRAFKKQSSWKYLHHKQCI